MIRPPPRSHLRDDPGVVLDGTQCRRPAWPHIAALLGGEDHKDVSRLLVRGHDRAVAGMPPPTVLARIAWRYYLTPRFAASELSRIGL